MATATLAQSQPRRTVRVLLRTFAGLLVAALLLLAAACGWFYRTAHRSLPQVDGSIRTSGLVAPVTVLRDAQGVPHITAANEADLFFAQGYVTAQDRLWQMDVSRRWGAGEIAEILGAQFLPHDREQRILGLRQAAERSAAELPPAERERWLAYVRGVNAYMEQQRENLPIEFRLLRYQPRPWTLADSLLCGINLAQALNHYVYLRDLSREAVTQKLGPELAADLYPNSSWRDHPPGQDQDASNSIATAGAAAQPESQSPVARRQLQASFRLTESDADFGASAPGSNNWVVSGAHTASGKPLLSNDMHLVNTIPNTWYEAHLRIRDGGGASFDVAGVTVPGMPCVIEGHNQRIAWGFTNLGPAVEDVYVENVNARGEYQTPAGWRPLAVRRETIHVRKQPDVTLEVRSTRHGPIINELVPGDSRTLALRWTLFEQPMSAPFFAVDAAQNWDDFRRAFAQFTGPGQNVVYGDVDGHIGYQATGRIPIRASGDGAMPVSGADDAHEWTGYIPFDKLPRVFDPPAGIIATANGRSTPDGYPYLISNEWAAPYRAERIYRLLQAGRKFSAQDMLAIQTDVYSEFDRFCAQRFVYAIDHAHASARARRAADILRAWDGRMSTDSAAPTLVTAIAARLWRMLLEPRLGHGALALAPPGTQRMGSGWRQYSWFMSTTALENLLAHQPPRWLPAGFANWDELLAAAADAALPQSDVQSGIQSGVEKDATNRVPRDLAAWNYGTVHAIELAHPIFAAVPLLRRWTGTGVWPLSGDGSTVKQAARNLGPSQRITSDLGDLDRSYLNIVTGQSGHILSPHYMDQWRAYYEGSSFPLAFTQAAVDKAAAHRLTLEPAR